MNIILDDSAKRDRMSEREESLLIHSTLLSAGIVRCWGHSSGQGTMIALQGNVLGTFATGFVAFLALSFP